MDVETVAGELEDPDVDRLERRPGVNAVIFRLGIVDLVTALDGEVLNDATQGSEVGYGVFRRRA